MRPLVAALALCVARVAGAQAPARVRVEAVPELAAVAPGGGFRVAVRLRIPDGSHISWINPGQSGLPTTLAWRTPGGVIAAETQWPYPERDETAGFVSHTYRGVVVVVTRFMADSSVRGGSAALRVDWSWGLCGTTCVLQRESVEIMLPIRAGPADTTAAWRALARSLEALPVVSAGLVVDAAAQGDSVRLTITGPRLGRMAGATAIFFPRPQGAAVFVRLRRAVSGIAVTLTGRTVRARPGALAGVLVADRPWLAGSPQRALAVDAVVP